MSLTKKENKVYIWNKQFLYEGLCGNNTSAETASAVSYKIGLLSEIGAYSTKQSIKLFDQFSQITTEMGCEILAVGL